MNSVARRSARTRPTTSARQHAGRIFSGGKAESESKEYGVAFGGRSSRTSCISSSTYEGKRLRRAVTVLAAHRTGDVVAQLPADALAQLGPPPSTSKKTFLRQARLGALRARQHAVLGQDPR
jgi:hypothetical protein